MATINYPSNQSTMDLTERAARTVMQASQEAGQIDLHWLQRFEQLDERELSECLNLAVNAPSDFMRGYLLAKASAVSAMGTT
jgi:hypothetical protein